MCIILSAARWKYTTHSSWPNSNEIERVALASEGAQTGEQIRLITNRIMHFKELFVFLLRLRSSAWSYLQFRLRLLLLTSCTNCNLIDLIIVLHTHWFEKLQFLSNCAVSVPIQIPILATEHTKSSTHSLLSRVELMRFAIWIALKTHFVIERYMYLRRRANIDDDDE